MAGQIWSDATLGGYMWSPNLSDYLRTHVQPMQRFRNFCDAVDGTEVKIGHGQTFYWNIYGDVITQGWRLEEQTPVPESNFAITQGSLTVYEAGQAIPYTGLLEDLAEHQVVDIIDKVVKNDARKYFDAQAWEQFNRCMLRVAPAGGTSLSSITVTENASTATTNNAPLTLQHIQAITDDMNERNIPGFEMDDYVCISHPTTLRPFRRELEDLKQYTTEGINEVFAGEIGRYDGMRFVRQNHIPKGGAIDSTTFSARTKTADAWNNAQSSWAFFVGKDTVAEGVIVPEEIRAKLPGDFGRSKGMMWYYLGGFGLIHTQAAQSRIMKWDSAA